jgi:molecular chaperone DnaK
MGGVLTPLITRNTTIPTTKSQVFSTAEDNQPSVDIVVFQGERPMARDNKLLGQFRLDGIRPARRGQPRIEVTFNIDVNGIVNVKAKDLDTNKEQQITISGSNGLSKDEIDRMVKEAEANKEADDKRKEEIEVKNKAESLISQIDEAMATQGDKMDASQKEQTQKIRDELKEALDKNDIATLKEKMNQLEQAAAMAQQYQSSPNNNASYQDPNSGSTSSSSSKDDDVIDADFTDKAN